MIRLKGKLRGMSVEDIRECLEAAVLICGANVAMCEVRDVNPDYGYEHDVVYVLNYTFYGSDKVHTTAL